jgi:hypothetical protein
MRLRKRGHGILVRYQVFLLSAPTLGREGDFSQEKANFNGPLAAV